MNPLTRCFGPVLGWEMTTLVRRSRYFWMRSVFAVVVFFVLWSCFGDSNYGDNRGQITRLAAFANRFFFSFSFLQLMAVLLLTPAYVASSIAVEKQRRTIEYLFATDLRNREIVLGKWLARTANVLMLLLAGMPIMSIAQLLGGIDPDRQIILVLMCAAATASTAALSIFVSVHSGEVRRALGNAYALLCLLLLMPLLYLAAIHLAAEVADSAFGIKHFEATIDEFTARLGLKYFNECAHPLVFYYSAIESSWTQQPLTARELLERTATFAAAHAAITAVLLTMAILQLRVVWLKQSGGVRRSWLTSLRHWHPLKRKEVKTVGDSPMVWKEWFFGEQRRPGCASRLVAILAVLAFYFPLFQMVFERVFLPTARQSWSAESVSYYLRSMGTVLIGLALGKVAIRAASSLGVERDRDCLVSLLATQLTARDIVQGKFIGSLKPLALTALFMTPMWLLAVFVGALSPFAVPCLLIVCTVFGGFVAGLGIHQSLKSTTTTKAIGVTLTICILLSGVAHGLLTIFMIPLAMIGLGGETLATLYYSSIPWVSIAGSMFGSTRIDESLAHLAPYILFWVIVYGAIGATLYRRAVDRFATTTGRTEDTLARPLLP